MSQCSGKKASGAQCSNQAAEGSEYCPQHDPLKRRHLRKILKENRAKKVHVDPDDCDEAPTTIEEYRDLLLKATHACMVGKLDHRRLDAMQRGAKLMERLFVATTEKRNDDEEQWASMSDDEKLDKLKTEAMAIESRIAMRKGSHNGVQMETALQQPRGQADQAG